MTNNDTITKKGVIKMNKRTKLMTVVVAVGTLAQIFIGTMAMSLPIWSTILLCKMACK